MQKAHFSFSFKSYKDMLIEMVNLFIMTSRYLTNILKVLTLKLTIAEAEMCNYVRSELYNLKIKPIFAFAFIFLVCTCLI